MNSSGCRILRIGGNTLNTAIAISNSVSITYNSTGICIHSNKIAQFALLTIEKMMAHHSQKTIIW